VSLGDDGVMSILDMPVNRFPPMLSRNLAD